MWFEAPPLNPSPPPWRPHQALSTPVVVLKLNKMAVCWGAASWETGHENTVTFSRHWELKDVKWGPGHRRSLPLPSDTFFFLFAFRQPSRELTDQAVARRGNTRVFLRPTSTTHRPAASACTHRFNHEGWRSWSQCLEKIRDVIVVCWR